MPSSATMRPRERRGRPQTSVRDGVPTVARATVYLAIALSLVGFWGTVGYLVWSLLA